MGPRQMALALLFGVHWAVFAWLFFRSRRVTLLLPMGVFTLLILTQLFWDSQVQLSFGEVGPIPLRSVLRISAWVLAVPSLGVMLGRIHLRIRRAMTTSLTSRRGWLLVTVALGLTAGSTDAQAQQATDSARIDQLQSQVEAITRELERLSLGREVVEADSSLMGFGPAASKVYRAAQGVSIGGYGEFLYEGYADEREDGAPSGKTAQLDAVRGIVYVGYKFNDRILFNSETEVEHGSTGQAGSVSLEFAYLDYLLNDNVGVRAGLLLVPMGFVNELHEPPVFLGTERPVTENRIIPTTWRESGIGVFGGHGPWSYRAYVVNSLDGVGGGSSKAKGFDGSGLRGGRQKGSKALAEDFGFVGRLDYGGLQGVTVGGSAYYGETAHGRELDGQEIGGAALIWEGHLAYKARGWDIQALVASAELDEVEELNALKGLTGGESIGESMLGWYVQAGYDVLRSASTRHQLIPYFRYEAVDTQRSVPAGYSFDPSNDLTVLSLGMAWKPIANTVLKADYQIHGDRAETGVNQFNVSLGYLF